ncbi:sensor histidine kinase [Defluviitalea raffinosedens]|uniref:sensor histidine kinase n=1 Tax=Defluviitalea raffinosedens TaxID=1450156 RepID=UPI0019599AF4|nr:histidine kinase [Defluviitalea raffinosedens]MBM7685877.1 sensor histidine kinase YesM [Defluviitalea raffinosedens]
MGEIKRKVFKEEIRKTFILYAVTPILIFSILSYNFLMFYGEMLIKRQNIDINYDISKVIEKEITHYIDQVEQLSSSPLIINYINHPDQINTQSSIYEMLYNFINSQKIRSVFYITDNKGNTIIDNSFCESPYNNYEIFLSGIFKQMKQRPDEIIVMINRVQLDSNIRTVYSIGKAIVHKGEIIGYIIFDLLEKDWNNIIHNYDLDIVVITDKHKNAIISTNNLILDSLGKFKFKIHKNKYIYIRDTEKYYIHQSKRVNGNILIFTLTSMRFMNGFYLVGLIFLLILFVLLSIVIVCISKGISASKTKSIDELLYAIKKVQEGDLDFCVHIDSNDEFELIGNCFNDMLIKLKELISKNNELVNRNRMSEIMQLEAQFNPHFLFNTLETLKYMIKIDTQKAVQIVVGLANLLRYSINYEDGNVSIQKDIKYIEDYLMIQKYRFNKRLEYTVDIQEEAKNCAVPKLIIQPIIENSINHGYSKKEKLEIILKIFIKSNKLILEIADNGDGIPKERLEEILTALKQENLESKHIGLYNVHRRIQLLYGTDYGIHIDSVYNEGTKVTIDLPVLRGEDNV